MLSIVVTLALFVAGEAVAAIVFGVRQEGRITAIENRQNDIKELFGSKLDDIKERLIRVERHVLNGHAAD